MKRTGVKRACVVGATGYAGRELCGLLARHPYLELTTRMSTRPGAASDARPDLAALDPAALGEFDAVFLCTPHGAAAPLAQAALEGGATVVDLSADFRLRDPALYRATFGVDHPCPNLLDAAVYGLTEHARPALTGARLVANPGCYPTAVLLGLLPLLRAGLVDDTAPIVADAKSGVSGAGKSPSEITHYANVHENFRAYAVGTHRHTPEIQQAAETDRVVFVAHLLPCLRGILATLYLQPADGANAAQMRECLQSTYAGETFVHVASGSTPELPELRAVQHTNHCHLGVAQVGPLVVVVSVIDNLLKGAAGQALQNMNLALGLEESAGLA